MKKFNKQILEAINRGIQIALDVDDFEEQQNEPIAPKRELIKNNNSVKDLIDFHNSYVDLGLPSGTLWCKFNLGCDIKKLIDQDGKINRNSDAKEWYGNYYAWGELNPKDEYLWDNYKFSTPNDKIIKYTLADSFSPNNKADYISKLLPEDDAAYQVDHRLKIPTKEQFEELFKYTEPEYLEDFLGITGLKGYALCAQNHKYIFVPCAGCYSQKNGKMYENEEAYLWEANVASFSRGAFRVNIFGRGTVEYKSTRARCEGLPIRPVVNKI